jgi:hypothetical protein
MREYARQQQVQIKAQAESGMLSSCSRREMRLIVAACRYDAPSISITVELSYLKIARLFSVSTSSISSQ